MMRFDLDHALEMLARTPGTLRALLKDLPEGWGEAAEGEGTWCPFDIVGHLIHGEETDWIPRARIILTEGEARQFDPFDRFAQLEASKGKSMEGLLDSFGGLRAANLSTVREWNLTADQLDLTGLHPTFGVVTLRQLLSTWVVHDLGHIAQIARVMGKRYAEDVGPWKEFLPVLRRS